MELNSIINEKAIQKYIDKNSPIILNNTLNNFIKDKSYNNIKNDIIKDNIFNFASFINSCKEYNNILKLKSDIKVFFRNNNKKYDNKFHIIDNYLTQLSKIISKEEFFKHKDNIKLLIKVIKKFDKNFCSDFFNKNIEYIDIQKKIIDKYEDILITFAKNNSCEKVNDFIVDLIKNIEDLKNKLNFVSPNIYHKNNKKNLTKNINHQEKENATLNIKISGKEKISQIGNNSNNDKFIFNLNQKSRKVININKESEIKKIYNHNYENLMFPPIQNNDDINYNC